MKSYEKILSAADKRLDAFYDALEGWFDTLKREEKWEEKSKLLANTSSLLQQHDESIDKYNQLIKLDLRYKEFYTTEARKNFCERFEELLDGKLKMIKHYRENEEERTKDLTSNIQSEEELSALINKYQPKVLQTLHRCYTACKELIINHMDELQQPPVEEDDDVFSAIHADNYKRFLACFSRGVDMCKYDTEGYSPLTLACRMGNNEMVKFFIENNVDLSKKDGRGYNAIETAAIYNFRDICELLCKADKTLVGKSGDLVELSKQNSFTDWISKL